MIKPKKSLLTLTAGCLLTALTMGCSGNKSESSETNAQSETDTTVMGVQGDTTNSSLDGPVSAPTDTAAGQTLPEATMKVRDQENK